MLYRILQLPMIFAGIFRKNRYGQSKRLIII